MNLRFNLSYEIYILSAAVKQRGISIRIANSDPLNNKYICLYHKTKEAQVKK